MTFKADEKPATRAGSKASASPVFEGSRGPAETPIRDRRGLLLPRLKLVRRELHLRRVLPSALQLYRHTSVRSKPCRRTRCVIAGHGGPHQVKTLHKFLTGLDTVPTPPHGTWRRSLSYGVRRERGGRLGVQHGLRCHDACGGNLNVFVMEEPRENCIRDSIGLSVEQG